MASLRYMEHSSAEKTMTIVKTPMAPSTGTTTTTSPRSPWHSPVPYLFGGLAAMLGLIAFALLILACSYWRLSGYLEGGGANNERDLESGDSNGDESDPSTQKKLIPPQFLVIMPGQEKPTCLATPMSSRASSFGSSSSTSSSSTSSSCNTDATTEKSSEGDEENEEKKQDINGTVTTHEFQMSSLAAVETAHRHHDTAADDDGQVQ